jgi:hypothetical protein
MSRGVSSLEALLAFKALLLLPNLSLSERRVAGILVDHFNRRDGRCDPGVDRMSELLGLDRSTVLRAVVSLHRRRICNRVRHGGKSQRNSYEPNWELLGEFLSSWNARLHGPSVAGVDVVAATPPKRSHAGHSAGGTDATQTCLKNPIQEPAGETPRDLLVASRPRGGGVVGQARSNKDAGDRSYQRRATRSREAASEAALRRWNDALLRRLRDRPEIYERVVQLVDAGLQADATAAEMRTRGAGVELILAALGPRLHGSSLGPLPVAGISAPDDAPARPGKPGLTIPDDPDHP